MVNSINIIKEIAELYYCFGVKIEIYLTCEKPDASVGYLGGIYLDGYETMNYTVHAYNNESGEHCVKVGVDDVGPKIDAILKDKVNCWVSNNEERIINAAYERIADQEEDARETAAESRAEMISEMRAEGIW